MKYIIRYSGFLGGKPIDGSTEVESISITGALQNFVKKMSDKSVDIKSISVVEKEPQDESAEGE